MKSEALNHKDDDLRIMRCGDPTPGGAHAAYVILGIAALANNPAMRAVPFQYQPRERSTSIVFRTNPDEADGVTMEALLDILKDRLEGFQSGPFACEENARALAGINDAIKALETRTKRLTPVEPTPAPEARDMTGEEAAAMSGFDQREKTGPPPMSPVGYTQPISPPASSEGADMGEGNDPAFVPQDTGSSETTEEVTTTDASSDDGSLDSDEPTAPVEPAPKKKAAAKKKSSAKKKK